MTDEHKLARDISWQAQAQALLDNQLLQESFAYLEKLFVDGWKVSTNPALREELWRSQANLANLRKHLTTVLNNGKLAQAEIDQLTAKRKRFGVV